MALIERLMGILPEPRRKIPVHEFTAACYEITFGPRTVVEIKTYYQMDAADSAEFDLLVAKVAGADAVKHRIIFQFEQVLILAEMGAPFYNTPTLVRARLGI